MKVTSQDKIDLYYEALLAKDASYLGIFIVGVISTGICCLPTCRARKPLLKNCHFYPSLKSALAAGFRPCKICEPQHYPEQMPSMVKNALDMLKAHPQEKVSDWMLKQANISPEVVRRWFQKNWGLTFQAYQRMLRINGAMHSLSQGATVTNSAMDSGYGSLSGFGYTFKKMTGKSPKSAALPLVIHRFTTPLGPMFSCASEKGLCMLEFTDRRMLETELGDLQRYFKTSIIAGENKHTKQAETEILEYFEGKRYSFDVALDFVGSEFQKMVWEQLMKIEYGAVTTYLKQAQKLNRPEAVRAVANANGANKISIIIPCHRVIGSDGSLTGYGGGLARKQWLLDHERLK